MKPKNLKFPFSWQERRPAFFEGVLIVPKYYDKHEQFKDELDLFAKEKKISVEYCSGNGDWIIAKAKNNPTTYWVAVEMRFERVRKIWAKMRNASLENLLIVCGEALTFTRYYLPDQCIDSVYVNFPDPWPKDRHAKHRLIQSSFVEEIARVIKKKGKATYVTDNPPYCEQMIHEMQISSYWKNIYPEPFYTQDLEGYGHSWFEALWRKKGRNFFYIQYERNEAS